jgi:hypothetical protein
MHKIDRRKLIVSGAIRAAALSVGAAPHRKKWVWRPIIGTREALLCRGCRL